MLEKQTTPKIPSTSQELSNEEVLQADPHQLSHSDFKRYKAIIDRFKERSDYVSLEFRLNVEYEELKARLHKARRDVQVYMVEHMEAVIKNNEIYSDYEIAQKAMNEKAQIMKDSLVQKVADEKDQAMKDSLAG